MGNTADLLEWLENFYSSQCDGDWEHTSGIEIATLDNPGWTISIDLNATKFQDASFAKVEADRSDSDWVHCWKKDGVWSGRGGSNNLREILFSFKLWVEEKAA